MEEKITSKDVILCMLYYVAHSREEKTIEVTWWQISEIICRLREKHKEFLGEFLFNKNRLPYPDSSKLQEIWGIMKMSNIIRARKLDGMEWVKINYFDEDLYERLIRIMGKQGKSNEFYQMLQEFKEEILKTENENYMKV